MKKLLLATRNLHKVNEIRAMLGNSFECVSLKEDPDAPEVVEDAATFEGNALKKAEQLAAWLCETGRSSLPDYVLADDSGLEVDALDGAPGVFSARFAALDTASTGNSTDSDNNAKLLRLLANVALEQRTARFRCVLALVSVNPKSSTRNPQCFNGACEGKIGFKPHGEHGFGYDPLFVPDGFTETFATLGEATKNRISHRSNALARLVEWAAVSGG